VCRQQRPQRHGRAAVSSRGWRPTPGALRGKRTRRRGASVGRGSAKRGPPP
jgi:hypothetical protein